MTHYFQRHFTPKTRVGGALWQVNLPIPEKFDNHVTVHRPSDRLTVRSHHKETNVNSQSRKSYFGGYRFSFLTCSDE